MKGEGPTLLAAIDVPAREEEGGMIIIIHGLGKGRGNAQEILTGVEIE